MTHAVFSALDVLTPARPILLIGPPGVGKSAMIAQWAERHDRELIIEHPVIAQSVDYRGLPVPAGDHADWLPLGTLRRICEPDCSAIVLFDDVGQASASVQAALMQLVLARRLGDLTIAPSVCFVLASNRAGDRSGAKPLLAALTNRVLRVEVGADTEVLAQWFLGQEGVDPLAAAYIRFRPDSFAKEIPADGLPFCSPRSLEMAARLIFEGRAELNLLAGCIGKPTAADYLAYREAATTIPPIGELLAAPSKAKKHMKDVGLAHAITVMAAGRAMAQPSDVTALAEAIGGGWECALIGAATDMHPEFKATPEFQTWAAGKKSLL